MLLTKQICGSDYLCPAAQAGSQVAIPLLYRLDCCCRIQDCILPQLQNLGSEGSQTGCILIMQVLHHHLQVLMSAQLGGSVECKHVSQDCNTRSYWNNLLFQHLVQYSMTSLSAQENRKEYAAQEWLYLKFCLLFDEEGTDFLQLPLDCIFEILTVRICEERA